MFIGGVDRPESWQRQTAAFHRRRLAEREGRQLPEPCIAVEDNSSPFSSMAGPIRAAGSSSDDVQPCADDDEDDSSDDSSSSIANQYSSGEEW